jgi:hypothetical protein
MKEQLLNTQVAAKHPPPASTCETACEQKQPRQAPIVLLSYALAANSAVTPFCRALAKLPHASYNSYNQQQQGKLSSDSSNGTASKTW